MELSKEVKLMSFQEKIRNHISSVSQKTNKQYVFDILNAVDEYDDIIKTLRFVANRHKQDLEGQAQEMLDSVEVNLQRLERLTDKLRKKLG